MDNYKNYLESISKYTQLSESESMERFETIQAHKRDLITHNLRLVAIIAKSIHRTWPDFDVMDFIQEGNISLINSVEIFNPNKDVKFSLFVAYRVKQDIITFIKNNTGPINIFRTREQRKILNNLAKLKTQLESCAIEAVASSYDISIAGLTSSLETNKFIDVLSITDNNLTTELICDGPEKVFIKNETTEVLLKKIKKFKESLTKIEQIIFYDHMYTNEKTMADIGRDYKLSRERVRQLKSKIIEKATKYFNKQDLYDLFS